MSVSLLNRFNVGTLCVKHMPLRSIAMTGHRSSQIIQTLTGRLLSDVTGQRPGHMALTGHGICCLTTKVAQGIHENISSLQMKKRPQRKKRVPPQEEEMAVVKPGFWSVTAYATAEEYDLHGLMCAMQKQELYDARMLGTCTDIVGTVGYPELDVLHAVARYAVAHEPREMFFFREGTCVMWNMSELESSNVLAFVRGYEHNAYDELLVQAESDTMSYSYCDSGPSQLTEGSMLLANAGTMQLDKYTFSNSMALSVKLGVWEASLDRYVDSIEYVVEDLKQGHKIQMSRQDVLRKTGELFALRHLINLSSDLLDTPDFYWDREQQEALYHQTCAYFSIQRRTRVMNEKLNHCVELVDLLSSHLSDRHHVRLEWMIIILIMVEVGFEVLHYAGRVV